MEEEEEKEGNANLLREGQKSQSWYICAFGSAMYTPLGLSREGEEAGRHRGRKPKFLESGCSEQPSGSWWEGVELREKWVQMSSRCWDASLGVTS